MNIKVVYYSETGNTKLIAESIAESVGVTAELISDDIKIENVDVLFVGGFLKAFTLVKPTKDLLKKLQDPAMAKHVAVFSTSASGNGILKYAKKFIKNPQIDIMEDHFKCQGAYRKSNAGKPDKADCKNAKAFAQLVLKRCDA